MGPGEEQINERVRTLFGTIVMAAASLFAVAIFSDRMEMQPFEYPDIWHSTRSLHLLLCGVMFFCAAQMLKSSAGSPGPAPRPLFSSCRLFTRRNCRLCDEAVAVLSEFQNVLPIPEIVDIDETADLVKLFGESVPVVEIDGKIRFRGAVNPQLLQRLIDAALCRLTEIAPESTAATRKNRDSAR